MALTPGEARAMTREAEDSPEDYAARGCVICPHCGQRVEGATPITVPRWLWVEIASDADETDPRSTGDQPEPPRP